MDQVGLTIVLTCSLTFILLLIVCLVSTTVHLLSCVRVICWREYADSSHISVNSRYQTISKQTTEPTYNENTTKTQRPGEADTVMNGQAREALEKPQLPTIALPCYSEVIGNTTTNMP